MTRAVVGVIDMNFKGQGWSEKYTFKASVVDPQDALPLLQQIVFGRSALMGAGVTIIYARCSLIGGTPDARVCELDYPIGPHPSWTGGNGPGDTLGPPNEAETCIQQRFESAVGKWGMRYYHAMPDSWVSNKILQPGIVQYWRKTANGLPSGTDLGPAGGLSHLSICQSFWSYLLVNTAIARRSSSIDYTLSNIVNIIPIQVTSKKVGRSFRQSAGRRPATLIR